MVGRFSVQSAFLRGVDAMPVEVEVVSADGLPGFAIVGMADAAVQESRERVKAAIKAAGFEMPGGRIVVNLAPSSVRKSGSGFDLPIAVALLAATKQIPVENEFVRRSLFVGELSLDGRVRPVAGLLAYAIHAASNGLSIACANAPDLIAPIEGLTAYGLNAIHDLRDGTINKMYPKLYEREAYDVDFAEVAGNEVAKRALQVAAAGNHGVLMMGPPGSGKTMLASRLPTILPPLEADERLKVALIHSVAGEEIGSILAGARPFRAPHHSATAAGILGGGNPLRPGAMSLAHFGVLFLDELPEFKPSVLQQMRQPMESGAINLTRASGNVVFPARFMLVAASNPCPCGYYGDAERTCTCSESQVRAYQNRIGGPLMDRIDIHIDVGRVDPKTVLSKLGGTSSEKLKDAVMKAREYASWRISRYGEVRTAQDMIASCMLDERSHGFLERAARHNSMSGRAITRTLAVARTVADMAELESVGVPELSEALGYRVREGVGA